MEETCVLLIPADIVYNKDDITLQVTGVSSLVSSLDPMNWTRSYAVDYYHQSKHRLNLKVS
jgi:hypothetical protein